jgi:hypothetical protein
MDLRSAITLTIGLTLSGALVGQGLASFRTADRTVSVKGTSERDVTADLAIWPLRLVAASDDLAAASNQLARSITEVKRFLARHGLDSAAVSMQGFQVEDARTNQFSGNQASTRFVIRQTLVVRSTDPPAVLAASQRVGDLLSVDVAISSGGEYGTGGPSFLFTKLNDFKPAMIAEATARAREAAEQFAADAGANVGGIRSASQGYFEILPRDAAGGLTEEGQLEKRLRVVTTIVYGLK